MKEQDPAKTIEKLKADLDNAYRDMSDGVRDWLCLKDGYYNLRVENNALRAIACALLSEKHDTTTDVSNTMLTDMMTEKADKMADLYKAQN